MSIKRVSLASAICLAFTVPAFAQVEMTEKPVVETDVSTQVETEAKIETKQSETIITSETENSDSVIIDLPREDVAGSVETFTPKAPLEKATVEKNESIMAAPEMSLDAPELDMEAGSEISTDTEVELWSNENETEDMNESVQGEID